MKIITLDSKKGRSAKITGVDVIEFIHPQKGKAEKLQLTIEDEDGCRFRSCDTWTKNGKVGGMYITGAITQGSKPLGQLMTFLNVKTTVELIGKRIYIYPTHDNYMLPVSFDPELIEDAE